MRHKDGTWRWIRDTGRIATRTADGQPEWLSGAHFDITSLKQTQQSLLENQARLEAIFSSLPVVVYTLAADGRVIRYIGTLTDVTELNEAQQRLDKIAASIHGLLYQYEQRADGSSYFPYASEGITRIFGVTAEQARQDAQAVFAVIHPDDLPRLRTSIQHSAMQLDPWLEEYRVVLQGNIHWLYSHSIPEPTTEGGVLWHGFLVDITDRKRIEIELELSQSRVLAAQEVAQLGYWELTLNDQQLTWSALVYHIVGVDAKRFQPSFDAFRACVHVDDRPLVDAALNKVIEEGAGNAEFRLVRPNGDIRWVREWAIKRTLADGQEVITGTLQDITERKELELLLRSQSLTDALTGLFNRRHFTAILEQQYQRVLLAPERNHCCVISADIDFFKRINDSYGHLVGDQVLRTLSDLLRVQVRSSDVVARIGGEEFAIILPRTELAEAQALAERLRDSVAAHQFQFTPGQYGSCTITLGVSSIHPLDCNAEAVLLRVDQALYQGKQNGRNQVVTAAFDQQFSPAAS